MSYAKLTSAWLAGSVPLTKGHDSLSDDDNWQSPQPLKQVQQWLDVSDGVSALNKSARVCSRLPHIAVQRPWKLLITYRFRKHGFCPLHHKSMSRWEAFLTAWIAAHVHFINILSKTLRNISNRPVRARLLIGQPSLRTANNPIEKLAGSPVLSSTVMNNSSIRVKAGRGDLVSDDWRSTPSPKGDTLHLTAASCVLGTVCFLWTPDREGQEWMLAKRKSRQE